MATRRASEHGVLPCDGFSSSASRHARAVPKCETAQTPGARYRNEALDEIKLSTRAASVMRLPTPLFVEGP
jgi:hypothetical protein